MAARRSSNLLFASGASSTTNPSRQCLFQARWCLYATASSWQVADGDRMRAPLFSYAMT